MVIGWTRTYLLQQVLSCGFTSARVDISCRFANFLKSLRNSTSMEVQVLSRFLARDVQSVTGKNIQLLFELTGLNPWTAYQTRLRDALVAKEAVKVPPQDTWCIPYLYSLLIQRREAKKFALEELVNEQTDLLAYLLAYLIAWILD